MSSSSNGSSNSSCGVLESLRLQPQPCITPAAASCCGLVLLLGACVVRAGQLPLLPLQQLQQREQLGPCCAEQCLVLLGAEQQRQPGLPVAVLCWFSSTTWQQLKLEEGSPNRGGWQLNVSCQAAGKGSLCWDSAGRCTGGSVCDCSSADSWALLQATLCDRSKPTAATQPTDTYQPA